MANVCMWCGYPKNKCMCMSKMLVTGLVALALGIALWWNYLTLNQTVALVLILWGAKKLLQGLMYKQA